MLNEFQEEQWYGFDAYDGAFHFFLIVRGKVVYIDTFGDCSAILEIAGVGIGRIVVSWSQDPQRFMDEALKFMTLEQYRKYFESSVTEGDFIEIGSDAGFGLFSSAFERHWEEECACILF